MVYYHQQQMSIKRLEQTPGNAGSSLYVNLVKVSQGLDADEEKLYQHQAAHVQATGERAQPGTA